MRKLMIFLLIFSLLFSLPSCSTSRDSQKTYEELKAAYSGIISQYTELLLTKHKGEALPVLQTDGMSEREAAVATAIYTAVDRRDTPDALKNMGYGYKDMDGNGTPELFLLNRYTAVDAIFTLVDGEPLLLMAAMEKGSSIIFARGGRFFQSQSVEQDTVKEITYSTFRIQGDGILYDAIYGRVGNTETNELVSYFQIVDGERSVIDKETYSMLYREREKEYQPNAYKHKLEAPRIHFPLDEGEADAGLPVADFSSYDAVRRTYQTIATCLDKFSLPSFLRGDYDGLFSFPDDASFEAYILLLFSLRASKKNIGYDEIDLNGDGLDELVFLGEDYRIRAIFTQKDGRPVLLGAYGSEVCWLDDQGKLHVDDETYDELAYHLYELTEEGELSLDYSILATLDGRYLTRDGKTEKISFEESLTLYYDDYCRYSEPFEPYEQTRNVSELTYTPLDSENGDPLAEALGKTWHKYANLEKSSDKEFARSNTYITFVKETDTSLAVQIDYRFTFSYPDPDNDRYLLDETTESSMVLTAKEADGVFAFEEGGVKGHFELFSSCVWMVIEESTDERFPVGHHCFTVYDSDQYL